MISEPGNEKAAMARGISIPMTRPMMMADEPQIKQTRKILMIILGVCVVRNRRAKTLLACFEASGFVSSRRYPLSVRFLRTSMHKRKMVHKWFNHFSSFFCTVLAYSSLMDIMSWAYALYVSSVNFRSFCIKR